MVHVYRVLAAIFLASLPMTDAFALHEWLPLPFCVLLVFFGIYLIEGMVRGRFFAPKAMAEDQLLFLFLFAVFVSTTANLATVDDMMVRHLMSYVGVIGVYYFGSRTLFRVARLTSEEALRRLVPVVIGVSVFGILEFMGKNYFDVDIQSAIPRSTDGSYAPLYDGLVVRARAFMSESGSFALFLELFGPLVLAILWMDRRFLVFGIGACLILGALFTTVSAAAVAALSVGVCVALAVAAEKRVRTGHAFDAVAGVVLFVALFLIVGKAFQDYPLAAGVVEKLTFSGSSSVSDRSDRWSGAISLFAEHPFLGWGAGGFLDPSRLGQGIVSWWLQILVESGVVGSLLLIAFLWTVARRALRTKSNIRSGYFVALGAATVHYAVISDYWLPWLWVLVAIVMLKPAVERGPSY